MLQEPPIDPHEYQNDSDVYCQPFPEVVLEEQDVHADHDSYQCEHVKHDGCLFSHSSLLLRPANRRDEEATTCRQRLLSAERLRPGARAGRLSASPGRGADGRHLCRRSPLSL